MGSKNFRDNIVLRVCLLAVTIFLLCISILRSGGSATVFFFLVLTVVQIVLLIRYAEKGIKEVSKFLGSIRYDDFSGAYPLQGQGKYFDALNAEFNRVMTKFREIRAEKEANYHYLRTVIQHIGIGIVAFDTSGKVQMVNLAAKKLFNIHKLDNIEELTPFGEALVQTLTRLHTGGKDLVKVVVNNDPMQLAMYAIELTLMGKEFKLVTLQNIRPELEEKEMEAWQNLIRVLTHEIMNSVTPISSLAATVDDEIVTHIEPKGKTEISKSDLEDIHLAVQTIKRRSEGLIRFVTDFRDLTKVPIPHFTVFPVKELVDRILLLMNRELEEQNITPDVLITPETLMLTADRELTEQVLINLIKNAVHALAENEEKQLEIEARQDTKSRVVIRVKDNGPGIEPEALDRIFIPFFTTKRSGSGIGLSLSRQIMRVHKGTISAKSIPGKETIFTLRF